MKIDNENEIDDPILTIQRKFLPPEFTDMAISEHATQLKRAREGSISLDDVMGGAFFAGVHCE